MARRTSSRIIHVCAFIHYIIWILENSSITFIFLEYIVQIHPLLNMKFKIKYLKKLYIWNKELNRKKFRYKHPCMYFHPLYQLNFDNFIHYSYFFPKGTTSTDKHGICHRFDSDNKIWRKELPEKKIGWLSSESSGFGNSSVLGAIPPFVLVSSREYRVTVFSYALVTVSDWDCTVLRKLLRFSSVRSSSTVVFIHALHWAETFE